MIDGGNPAVTNRISETGDEGGMAILKLPECGKIIGTQVIRLDLKVLGDVNPTAGGPTIPIDRRCIFA